MSISFKYTLSLEPLRNLTEKIWILRKDLKEIATSTSLQLLELNPNDRFVTGRILSPTPILSPELNKSAIVLSLASGSQALTV